MFTSTTQVMSRKKDKMEEYLLDRRQVLAKNLKLARKAKAISQEQLSEITGLTQQTISKIENAKNLTIDNANIVAAGVGIPLSELLTPPDK